MREGSSALLPFSVGEGQQRFQIPDSGFPSCQGHQNLPPTTAKLRYVDLSITYEYVHTF